MSRPAAKGSKITRRQHFEQIEKTRQKRNPDYRQPELEAPPLPESLAYLWKWYVNELQTGERLSWGEIRSWSEILKRELKEFEALLIRKLSFIHNEVISRHE